MLNNKVAVVTGSTSGIGLGIANVLAAQGADIVLNGFGDAAETTSATLGRIDILVNNAGIQFTAPVEEFPAAKWDAILAINLSAAFHGIAAAVPHMKKQRWGRIVNVASAHGLVGSVHKAAYVAAKHGLVGLTKVVGLETAGTGVTANAVCPGWVRTPLVEKQIADIAAERKIRQETAAAELLGGKQPSGAFVTPAPHLSA